MSRFEVSAHNVVQVAMIWRTMIVYAASSIDPWIVQMYRYKILFYFLLPSQEQVSATGTV